jgi:hypothetical protein
MNIFNWFCYLALESLNNNENVIYHHSNQVHCVVLTSNISLNLIKN